MLKTILVLFIAGALSAQDAFKVAISRWSTTWPAPLANVMPSTTVAASGLTVVVEIDPQRTMDAVIITLRYEQGGKRYRRWQVAFPARHGCSPEPCQFAVSHFVVGDVDAAKASAEITPVVWKSEEEE